MLRLNRTCLLFALSLIAIFVGGCATLDPNSAPEQRDHELRGDAINAVIPQSAQLVEAGNRKVSAITPSDGELYLFDTNTEKVVCTLHVEKSQQVTVDTLHARIAVDGGVVYEHYMPRRHVYQIYLDPGATVAVSPITQGAQASSDAK